MFTKRIAIDLGTVNTLVYVPKRAIVVNEPSVVAISLSDKKVLAVGNEAREMIGRTPETIVASRPLKEGVIADYRTTESMLRYFVNKALGGIRFFRPEVMIAVPAGITSTERRAVVDATLHAGAKAAYIIKQPIASAIGAGIPIGSASGHMIIEIGGGTTEIAVISLGGIVCSTSVRIGGTKFDAAIIDYIRKKYNLAIGERSAERLKMEIGAALLLQEPKVREVRGRDTITGLPRTVVVTSHDITEAISDELQGIIEAIKRVLQETPPELSADVIEKGMVISGGSSQLAKIDELFSHSIDVPAYLADNPLENVVKGTGIALENLETYKRSILAA